MWQRCKAFVGSLAEEIGLSLGCVLAVVGLWPWVAWGALLVPACVLIWLTLPTRGPWVSDGSRKTRT